MKLLNQINSIEEFKQGKNIVAVKLDDFNEPIQQIIICTSEDIDAISDTEIDHIIGTYQLNSDFKLYSFEENNTLIINKEDDKFLTDLITNLIEAYQNSGKLSKDEIRHTIMSIKNRFNIKGE